MNRQTLRGRPITTGNVGDPASRSENARIDRRGREDAKRDQKGGTNPVKHEPGEKIEATA